MKKVRWIRVKYLLIALPFLAWFVAFFYVPVFGWAYSFVDFKMGARLGEMDFVGFDNFLKIWQQRDDLMRVLRNTLVLSFASIACSVLPVIFAIMLNEIRHNKYKKVIQTITTLPHFISWIVVFGVAFAMFSSGGFLHYFRQALGMQAPEINLLGNKATIWTFLTALGVWKDLGWNAIIYLAAIAGIDAELYDAARVDGASRMQSILHVTVPGIAPTFLVLLLLNISNILSNGFEKYFTFYNPMVAEKVEVLDYYVYKVGILIGDYSMSVAIGMFKSLISILLLFFVNTISKVIRGESIF